MFINRLKKSLKGEREKSVGLAERLPDRSLSLLMVLGIRALRSLAPAHTRQQMEQAL